MHYQIKLVSFHWMRGIGWKMFDVDTVQNKTSFANIILSHCATVYRNGERNIKAAAGSGTKNTRCYRTACDANVTCYFAMKHVADCVRDSQTAQNTSPKIVIPMITDIPSWKASALRKRATVYETERITTLTECSAHRKIAR